MLKVAIIHGKTPMDGKNLDGQITYVTTDDEQENHIVTLTGFLEDHYLDNKGLQQLNYRYPIQTACYLFNLQGDIMFIDTSGSNPKKHSESGTFMMPDTITEQQKEGLNEIKKRLEKHTDIRVDYDIKYDDGIFDSRTLRGQGENAVSVIDNYLAKDNTPKIQK